MNESFLNYIWQFQYFRKNNLPTSKGEPISILKTGFLNTHAGPDFADAKVRINGIEWVGTVEIRVKSSDWDRHKHQTDAAYENVILHVVWENDKPVIRNDKTKIPTLELGSRVDESLVWNNRKLVSDTSIIACEKSFPAVDDIVKLSMLDRALTQRLENKAHVVKEQLDDNQGDWDETVYQLLARNFGFKVNADPFFQLARSLPFKIIQKQSLLQVEPLQFGNAGMLLTKTLDSYITQLFREYQVLAQKYSLRAVTLNYAQCRFLRLRPANFPTLRIAQFASFLFTIFSNLLSSDSFSALERLFLSGQSDSWKTHFHFGKKAKGTVPEIGEASIQNIVINAIAPVLVAYGKYKGEQLYVDRAVGLLQQLSAEQNKVTRIWASLGLKVKIAFNSQALIELHNFCMKRMCLNCNIGVSILTPRP